MEDINKELLIERISELATKRGISMNAVFVESGAGKNFKSNLSTANPSLGKITLIANYLNTSSEYLLGKTDIKEKALPEQEELKTDTESLSSLKKLLDLYNELNTEGQEKLVSYADDLVTSGKYATFKIYRAAHSDTNNPAEIKNVGKEFVKALEEAPETDEKF